MPVTPQLVETEDAFTGLTCASGVAESHCRSSAPQSFMWKSLQNLYIYLISSLYLHHSVLIRTSF
jgi:hypothetical protein